MIFEMKIFKFVFKIVPKNKQFFKNVFYIKIYEQ